MTVPPGATVPEGLAVLVMASSASGVLVVQMTQLAPPVVEATLLTSRAFPKPEDFTVTL